MPLATMSDAVREFTYNVGRERPDLAWILSPYDSWSRNPFYLGNPVPHPEDDFRDEDDFDPCACPSDDWRDELDDRSDSVPVYADLNDDIPF